MLPDVLLEKSAWCAVVYEFDARGGGKEAYSGTTVRLVPAQPGLSQPSPMTDSGSGMNVAPENVRLAWLGSDETGQASLNFPSWKRIVPGRPALSLVYQRIHCDDSPPGRMPPGHPGGAVDPQFLQLQALVHDWIALGAIMVDTDRRFAGDFETLR